MHVVLDIIGREQPTHRTVPNRETFEPGSPLASIHRQHQVHPSHLASQPMAKIPHLRAVCVCVFFSVRGLLSLIFLRRHRRRRPTRRERKWAAAWRRYLRYEWVFLCVCVCVLASFWSCARPDAMEYRVLYLDALSFTPFLPSPRLIVAAALLTSLQRVCLWRTLRSVNV